MECFARGRDAAGRVSAFREHGDTFAPIHPLSTHIPQLLEQVLLPALMDSGVAAPPSPRRNSSGGMMRS
jgi:hypothetical protein